MRGVLTTHLFIIASGDQVKILLPGQSFVET